MNAMLPASLEALMRMEGRGGQIPTEQDVGMLGMPIGMPMSNQAPYQQRRNVPSGSLGALSQLIAGLGGPMPGYEQSPTPDPQTLVMRSFMSPGGGGEGAFAHGASLVPQGDESLAVGQMQRQFGGVMPTQEQIFSAQANAARTGQGMGIVDPAKHAAWKQGMADDEAARRAIVTSRAMQEAQARTNRRSGMDPRTAALLAAMGDDQGGLGGMVLADQLLGKGAGLEMRQQDQTDAFRRQALQSQQGQAAPAGGQADPAKDGATAIQSAIRSGDSAAIGTALANEARAVVAELRKTKSSDPDVFDGAIHALRTKHGATQEQAVAAVEQAMGMAAGSLKNREGRTSRKSTTDSVGDWLYDKFKTGRPSFF